MKKWIISILAVLIIGGGVTAGAVLIVKNQPENVAISAVAGVFEDAFERPEVEPLVNMLMGGSLSINVTEFKDVYEGEYIDRYEGEYDMFAMAGISKVGGKIYFSNDNKLFLENFGVDFKKGSLRADALISDELVYVKSDLLGGAYGVEFKDALDQFEDSIFHKGSDGDFALDDSESDLISDLLEGFADDKDYGDLGDDAKELLEYYVKEAWDIFCDNIEIDSETKEVKLGKEKTKARVVFFAFDSSDLAKVIEGLAEFVETDKKLQAFIEKYEDVFASALESFDVEADEIVDELVEFLEDYADYLDDSDSFEEIRVEIVTPKLSSKLLKLSVAIDSEYSYSYDGYSYSYTGTDEYVFDFGKDGVADSNSITITTRSEGKGNDSYDGKYDYKYERSYVYEVTKNTSDRFTSSLVDKYSSEIDYEDNSSGDDYEYEDEDVYFEIDINKKSGKFTLDIDEDIVISGKYASKGDTTTFTIEEIKADYWESDDEYYVDLDVNIEITIDEKDSIPSIDSYKKISDVTDDDIYDWEDELFTIVEESEVDMDVVYDIFDSIDDIF